MKKKGENFGGNLKVRFGRKSTELFSAKCFDMQEQFTDQAFVSYLNILLSIVEIPKVANK